MSTILGSQMLSDASAFVQSLDSTFGGFREKADRTYELLKRRGTQFVVVSAAEPDALREASFFVDRLSAEGMPLAGGLILNRTHPTLSSLTVERAIDGIEGGLEAAGPDNGNQLAAAVLQIHADRAQTAKREVRLLSRFTGAIRMFRWLACPRCRSMCRISTPCRRLPIRSRERPRKESPGRSAGTPREKN